MADFPKKQQQCLIPKYLLDYLGEVNELHPDPSDLSGGDNIEPGTGIVITGDDTKTISVDDETVAMVANLAPVAFSGSYSNLSDKPDLSVYELKEDAFTGDYGDLTNKPDLSVYELKSEAFSGDYNDLTNKPSIPTKTSDLYNDSGYITGVTWNDIYNKPTFATVATSGDYDDLINKPTIPVVPTNVSAFSNDAGYITGIDSSDVISALGYTPGTSNFSGDYNDLTNKPTIPTATSQLTNDSGFVTNASLTNYVPFETESGTGAKLINAGNYYGPGYEPGLTSYNLVAQTKNTYKLPINKSGTIALTSDIPTNVSAFTNDAGYITAAQVPEGLEVLEITLTNDTYTLTAAELAKVQNGCIILYHRIMYPDTDLGSYSYPRGNFALYNEYVYDDIPYWQPALGNIGPAMMSKGLRITGAGVVTYRYDSNTQLAKVAATGDYNDLTNKPTIPTVPTNVSAFTNDAGYITGITSGMVTTALGYTPGTSNFSGDYDDLTDKPSIPSTASSTSTSTSTSTVTPTTVTLTFTYSDDTIENVTLMTGASVATSTTTTTTTTLS